MSIRLSFYRTILLCVLTATAFTLQADETEKYSEKAQTLLREMTTQLQEADAFRVDTINSIKIEAEGMKQEMASEYDFAVKRPDKLSMRLKRGMMGFTLVSDGETLISYVPAMKKYFEEDAPESIGEIPKTSEVWQLGVSSSMGGISIADAIISDDPYKAMMDGVLGTEYMGVENVDAIPCHRIKFIQEDMDWEIWISVKTPRSLRRVAPDMEDLMALMGDQKPQLQEMEMELSISYDNWDFSPELDDSLFKFEPPKDAEKGDSLFDSVQSSDNDAHPLIGRQAPDFELLNMDGDTVSLSDSVGQKVIVLDFWATWCGPCVKALPVLAEVTASYGDDVVFYAVNQREQPKTIERFLEVQEVNPPVLLDTDSSVGKAYGVRGIPQTVIIGKDGKVAKVHVGFIPGLDEQLRAELDELIDSAGGTSSE